MTPEEKQAIVDDEHLRLLALLHYISGGITVAFALLGGVSAAFVGVMFAALPPVPPGGANENVAREFQAIPAFMLAFFGLMVLMGIVFGVLQIVAGRCISQRRARVFTVIVAIPRLVFIPYGTLLSVFTLMVLERASVQQLYRRHAGP
ncbi:MAG TPA: hypothetical protein VGQ37_11355 [Vicinamibacterales bacterium]|jgi:hypothetical protein|nr:hypothetical protein [Vicinamibacterales bacterium]